MSGVHTAEGRNRRSGQRRVTWSISDAGAVTNHRRSRVGSSAGPGMWPRAPGHLLSFGDGHHRCPGGPLAILESDIFLQRLLAHDVVAASRPRVRWNPVSKSYDLDRFMLKLRD
jgi:cytochrome P450